MILSRDKKWLFVKTTKVGGTSVEIALSRLAGSDCVITPLLPAEENIRTKLNYPEPRGYELPLDEYTLMQRLRKTLKGKRPDNVFRNHSRAETIRKRLGEDLFGSLFKFSIVRNPFDYIVSKYHWKVDSSNGAFNLSFKDYVLSEPEALLENRRITSVSGVDAIDFFVRYEKMSEDFEKVSDRLGLDDQFFRDLKDIRLKAEYRSKNPLPSQRFDEFPEGLDLVRMLCAPEIATFGYDGPSK